jgi:hypothetical protein
LSGAVFIFHGRIDNAAKRRFASISRANYALRRSSRGFRPDGRGLGVAALMIIWYLVEGWKEQKKRAGVWQF